MKSIYRTMLLGCAALGMLTGCNDPDDPKPVDPVVITQGLLVVNQGSYYSNIEGSLSYVDFMDLKTVPDAFKAANGRSIGATPQDVIVYGTKAYVAVHQSDVIEVLDSRTFKSLAQIKPVAGQGTQPRYMAAQGGKVYISMFDGYVARLDTLSLTIDASVKVGPNPDGITIVNGYGYVANSDGYNWEGNYADGCTVSKFDLSSMKELERINVGTNPTRMCAAGGNAFVVVNGIYFQDKPMLKRIDSNGKVHNVGPATLCCANGNLVYMVNNPIDGSSNSYSVYNVATGLFYPMVTEPVDAPSAIAVDDLTGCIYIASYPLFGDGTVDYNGNGYVNAYSAEGAYVTRFNVGVAPSAMAFTGGLHK